MDGFEIVVEPISVASSTGTRKPKNPLNRPKMNYWKPVVALLIYAVVLTGLHFVPDWSGWLCLGWTLVYFAAIAKRTLIWFVHLYQNLAPDHVRLKCVFTPSCSEYMIMAVNKYGFFRGAFTGVCRLLRCHPPNGGEDYP
jgi:putative membrane protein insertion efficiency factor